MRIPPKYLIGAAVLAALGAGVAQEAVASATARLHTMQVAAPDGSVVKVRYAGDVAPQVRMVPVDAAQVAAPMADPFVALDRISALMDAQMNAMMRQAAVIRQQAAQMQQHAVLAGDAGAVPGLTVVGEIPKGAQVSYYSSSTDASGCTRTVSYSSDGSGAAPKVTQAASDGCDAVRPNAAAIPAKAEKPADAPAAPGRKV